jgi:2'-5' RNA ligase
MPRLFFALWPDDRIRAALVAQRMRIAHDFSGRPTRADTLHMTLLFLGAMPELVVPTLMACGDHVRAAPFTLCIDARSHFREARVAWLGATEPPAQLFALHDALAHAVRAAGISFDEAPYHPHITMARKCSEFPAPGATPPIEWAVESFVLVDSRQTPSGPIYRVLKHWPLHG